MINEQVTPQNSAKQSILKKRTADDFENILKNAASAHRQGRLAEAQKGYEKVLEQRPDWGQLLNALGAVYLDQSRPDRAKAMFERAARLNPPHLSACYNLGRMKQLENDHSGAITIYRAMLDAQPDMGEVWNNIGVAYREIGKPDEAISSFRKAVGFAPEMAEAWNNLGVAQDELHLTEKASDSYGKAIEIQPDYASAHLNLGISLQNSGQLKEAGKHYSKVLEIQPENKVAKFMLQSIGASETPEAAPMEHVRGIFDRCAQNFENILVKELEYKTPELLFDLVRPYLTEQLNILDIGCGTGLGAKLYQPFAKSLTGVDVSSKMLEKAAEKKLYNRLEVFDILQDWTFPKKFDLIYSSDVFVYFGNLDTIIGSASSYLVNGGIIAFSVEELADTSLDYQLFPSGRYAHSQTYIQDCLNCHGLQLIEKTQADIRKQSGNPVKGLLIAAIKRT
ncbi:two domain fusion protein (N:methyltransferase, C:TPR-repeat family protein) [Desulforapulum autotrophicum HRM2]|uniref:Two domain fusion protein (N:methyltransferase, C:TPR-repeat family protein) n=1 Tax=Desulforapulum autotrophicum (strain ATCC 43914 / DSM 3382 / VKM B-1955 / HRM2) TaxID=177437 RepID=C0QEA5_DESAH|nr:tetratricopeptide repeat protein [Desulforapulum autotrophicum]ACN13222.1 two domain fusion protein (N:methyltransferase, C:TPR-repeat family protein) [Desulforapulum autotrophicum HRM2]